jgi:glycosyltransferase involved in cell wall biosynthesis
MTSATERSLIAWLPDLRIGGAEMSLLAEARELQLHGWRVAVAHKGRDQTLKDLFTDSGIKVYSVDERGAWRQARAVVGLLRDHRPDVVMTCLLWPNLLVRPIARLMGFPVLTTLVNNDYGTEHFKNSNYGRMAVRLVQALDIFTSLFATSIRAISHDVAKTARRRLLLPASKIFVLYRGRDIIALRREPRRGLELRRQLRIPEEATVFISVGRQEPQKAHDVLVEAFARMSSPLSGRRLVLVGRAGANTPIVERRISDLRVGESVLMLGERSDVGNLLCAADAFVLSSRREGICGALIEAMAASLPLILSDIPTSKEVVGSDAWYFPINDAPECTLQMDKLMSGGYPTDTVNRVRIRAERDFDIREVGRQLDAVIRSMISPERS